MYTPKGELNDKLYEMMRDEEAVEKLAAAKSPEECYEVAKSYADVSFEEFQSSMEIMRSYLEESQDGLLSEEDLDQVAGGKLTVMGAVMVSGFGVIIVGSIASAFV
ncbi:MAG: hypothetical protein RR139_08185 [Lachnospiraceae bacterium]